MKVLWLINIVLPRVADAIGKQISHTGGGWLTGISNALLEKPGYELVVCSPDPEINEVKIVQTEPNLSCCLFPDKRILEFNPDLKNTFTDMISRVKPDVIHIFGTEYPRTLSMVEASDNSIPCVISITGMVSYISRVYNGSVPYKYRKKISPRRIISALVKTSTLQEGKRDF